MFCILFILILDKKKSKNEKKSWQNCFVILEKNCNLEWKKNWRVEKKIFLFLFYFNIIIIILFTFPVSFFSHPYKW